MLTSIKDLLQTTLRSIGFERRSRTLRALDLWPEVVGARWAARSAALDVRGTRLFVATDDPVVSQELSLRRAQTVAALNGRLGEGTVAEVVFIVRPDLVRGETAAPVAPPGNRRHADPGVERAARDAIDRYLRAGDRRAGTGE